MKASSGKVFLWVKNADSVVEFVSKPADSVVEFVSKPADSMVEFVPFAIDGFIVGCPNLCLYFVKLIYWSLVRLIWNHESVN